MQYLGSCGVEVSGRCHYNIVMLPLQGPMESVSSIGVIWESAFFFFFFFFFRSPLLQAGYCLVTRCCAYLQTGIRYNDAWRG